MLNRTVTQGKSRTAGHTQGDRLRCAREWAGYTVRSASDELGEIGIKKSDSTLSAYENDQIALTTAILLALCRLYDASPLWILLEIGPERWSELEDWVEHPELYAIEATIDRIAGVLADAPPSVRESAAAYWQSKSDALNAGGPRRQDD